MEETFNNQEKSDDRKERRVARKGKGRSSLWLPNNLMCNSRYYVDAELQAKHTGPVVDRTNDPELENWKRGLLNRESKR